MVPKAEFTDIVMRGLQRREIERKEADRLAVRLQYEWDGAAREHKAQAFRRKYRSRRK
jgi:hypothetical protein